MLTSWRARLVRSNHERKNSGVQKGDSSEKSDEEMAGVESPEDKCLICIFNVSPTVAHTMFHVNKSSTAGDIIKLALEKRNCDVMENAADFVLIEEIDIKKGKGKKVMHRMLNTDENVYLVQNSWKDSGKLTLTERSKVLVKLQGLDHHPSIRETQSDPVCSPRLRRPNGLVNRVRRLSRSIYYGQHLTENIEEESKQAAIERETVSDGEVSEEDDKPERSRKVSKAFRAVKIW